MNDRPVLACPMCRAPLERASPDRARCAADGGGYQRVDGIWRCLQPDRAAALARFVEEYAAVRRAEGRGSDDPAFYLSLPFRDVTGRYHGDWRVRASSFAALAERVLPGLGNGRTAPLAVLDLGAGNGWLAHRLALLGHSVAAVDLLDDDFDGLGAHVRHRSAVRYPDRGGVLPVQAEFDRLPFVDGAADLAIFNASLHYSTDIAATLREACRVVGPDGAVVAMDSPVYHDASSGARMVEERARAFEQAYGFRSDALPSENYLTHDRLDELARRLDVSWRTIEPDYGWRWRLRPWTARLLRRREPARFLLLVASHNGAAA